MQSCPDLTDGRLQAGSSCKGRTCGSAFTSFLRQTLPQFSSLKPTHPSSCEPSISPLPHFLPSPELLWYLWIRLHHPRPRLLTTAFYSLLIACALSYSSAEVCVFKLHCFLTLSTSALYLEPTNLLCPIARWFFKKPPKYVFLYIHNTDINLIVMGWNVSLPNSYVEVLTPCT